MADFNTLYEQLKASAESAAKSANTLVLMMTADENTDVGIDGFGLKPSFSKQLKTWTQPLIDQMSAFLDQSDATFDQFLATSDATFDQFLVTSDATFDQFLVTSDARVTQFLQNSGYQVIGDYTDGPYTLGNYNSVVKYDGSLYKLKSDTDVPFTTTGATASSWVNDSSHFYAIGGDMLSQQLASDLPGNGSSLIGDEVDGTVKDALVRSRLNTREIWRRSLAESGLTLVDGSFEEGASVQNDKQAVWHIAGGQCYVWGGVFPKTVPDNSTPLTSGGIADGAWVSVGDVSLRQELSSPGGAGLVGGMAKPVTSEAFSGGADPSGVDVSTPAFMSMFSAGGSHYIPDGDYNFGGVEFNPDYAPTVMVAGPNVRFPNGRINLGGAGKLMPNENQPIWSQHLIRRKYTSEDGWLGYGNIYQLASVAESNIPTSKNGKGGSQVVAVYGRGFANAVDSAAFGANFAAYANHATAYPVGVEINVGNYVAGGTGVGCQVISNGLSPMRAAHYVGSTVASSRYLSGIELSVGDNDGFVNQAILIGNQTTSNYYQTPCGIRARHTSFTDSELDLPSLYVGQTRYDVAVGGNKVEIRGAAQGGSARVLAVGSDANINLTLHGKGTGNVMVASSFRPETANTFSCGTSTAPWAGGFTQAAFTVTSDERSKTAPEEITDAMLDAAAEVDWCMFQYLDRVEEKGVDGARWHFGAIAQRYVEAFERHGLDAHRFAFICYDEWDDQYIQVQTNEGEVVVKTRTDGEHEEEYTEPAAPEYENVLTVPAGSRYGIRYEEMLVLEAALQRRNYERLAARIEALEGASHV